MGHEVGWEAPVCAAAAEEVGTGEVATAKDTSLTLLLPSGSSSWRKGKLGKGSYLARALRPCPCWKTVWGTATRAAAQTWAQTTVLCGKRFFESGNGLRDLVQKCSGLRSTASRPAPHAGDFVRWRTCSALRGVGEIGRRHQPL